MIEMFSILLDRVNLGSGGPPSLQNDGPNWVLTGEPNPVCGFNSRIRERERTVTDKLPELYIYSRTHRPASISPGRRLVKPSTEGFRDNYFGCF
jgi:hypothetical protein